MGGRGRRVAVVLVAGVIAVALSLLDPGEADAQSCPTPVVTGSHSGLSGTTHAAVVDGSLWGYFQSSHDNWQTLQIDYRCTRTLYGVRRAMGRIVPAGPSWYTISFIGTRPSQGEKFAYSMDGANWTEITDGTSTGWEGYNPYARGLAWSRAPYGWTEHLRLDTPAQARFLRYSWDGERDLVNEIEADFIGAMTVALSCLPGEPICTATASGGHPGGYSYSWTSSGVTAPAVSTGPVVGSLRGRCVVGSRFTVTVDASDGHGHSARASQSDTCQPPL